MSRSISKLESELGFKVFNRSGRTLQLTEPGSVFLEGVVSIRDQFKDLVAQARDVAGLDTGTLSIGVLEGQMLDRLTSETFSLLRSRYPSVSIDLCRLSYGDIPTVLDNLQIDIVLAISLCFENLKNLQTIPICKVPTHIVVPQDHPLAHSEDACLADFAADTFISCEDAPAEQYIHGLFEGCDNKPEVILAPDMQTQILWVESCKGLAISNPHNMMSNSPALAVVRPNDLAPTWFAAAWRQGNLNPLIDLFASVLGEVMRGS